MLLEDYTHKGKSKNCKPGLEDATFKEKHTDISMIKSLMRVWLKDLKKHIDSEMQVVINSATYCGKAFIHMNTWIAGKDSMKLHYLKRPYKPRFQTCSKSLEGFQNIKSRSVT